MKRLAVVVLLSLSSLSTLSTAAFAQSNPGTLPLELMIKNGPNDYSDMTTTDLVNFWDLANCDCHKTFGLRLKLTTTMTLSSTDAYQIWMGNDCATIDTTRPMRCTQLATIPDLNTLVNKTVTLDLDAAQAMIVGMGTSGACPQQMGQVSLFVLVDLGNNTSIDYEWQTDSPINVDTLPPNMPTDLKEAGGESSFSLTWTADAADQANLLGYQALCMNTKTGLPILSSPAADPAYRTTEQACMMPMPTSPTFDGGVAPVVDAGTIDAKAADAGPDARPATADAGMTGGAGWDALDPSYICSGLISPSSSNTTIDVSAAKLGAQDEVQVRLVAIDQALNSSFSDAETPDTLHPVRDLAEIYRDDGGKADGGYCFIATAAYGHYDSPYVRVLRAFRDRDLTRFGFGRRFIAWYYAHSPRWAMWLRAHPFWRFVTAVALLPVVVWAAVIVYPAPKIFLAILLLGLWGRRRLRRARKALAVATTLLVVGLATQRRASAQVVLDGDEQKGYELPKSDWVFELKAGLYHPDVDGESGLTGKPYDTVFGSGGVVMPQIEVDRFFLWPAGQLGVGFQLGFMQQSAYAFLDNGGMADTTMRSAADKTAFNLIPFSISAVYRFTYIADKTVVPIVPYAKLGLTYDFWWITKGGGAIATFPVSMSKANGGTAGWQGTLGLSLRGDKLDPEAARNLESEMGVEHAGFFFEVTFADVSGLFFSKKLHVGDGYWDAGVNFEF